ncbi:agmatine deiminase family protein [Aestuariibius sp. 2305UL40-4]|uniref:agmatine deiminase family protein n=1 Tax=Aestuariibius violaceus TaxID=3234132 RepID=UPI00345E7182
MMTRRTTLTAFAGASIALGLAHSLAAEPPRRWRVPDEGDRHERTFMQWPVSRDVYPEAWFLDDVQQAIARVANAIAAFEPVVMLAAHEHHAAARRRLSAAVELWDIPTDDLWARDSGPLFVLDNRGGLAVRHLNFNGWGGKQAHPHDGLVAARVAQRLGVSLLDNGLVGEPGGVEADGDGTLIAHESSWVNPNRNPGRTRTEVEALLLDAYGADHMIWAPGLAGEDITDFHIDALARFARPGAVMIQLPPSDNTNDPWVRSSYQTRDILANVTDAKGRALEVVEIADPLHPRVRDADFVPSYANHYVCNGAVVMAQFGDRDADAVSYAAIASLHPNREIVTLNVDALGWIGGGIHCATQQQPAV